MNEGELKSIREKISCPQFGDDHYGEWGALRMDQKQTIKRMIDYIAGQEAYIEIQRQRIEKDGAEISLLIKQAGENGTTATEIAEQYERDLITQEFIMRLKAEIERLRDYINYKLGATHDLMRIYEVEKAKAEAIKEFAENAVDRVEKARLKYQRLCKELGEEMEEHMHIHFNGIIKIIKDIEKEMVGDV